MLIKDTEEWANYLFKHAELGGRFKSEVHSL